MNQHQQRVTQGRAGGALGAAVIPAPAIVDNQNQNRGIYRARVISLARPGPASVLHLPGHRASAFYPRTAGGRCIGIQRRRLVASPPGRPAAALQFSAALLIGRSHQLNRIRDKPGSDLAYPFHSISPSSGVTFHAQEHEPKGVGSAQERVGEFQDVDHC
jgi:hypothetical protein